jgi:hypothetical protein
MGVASGSSLLQDVIKATIATSNDTFIILLFGRIFIFI